MRRVRASSHPCDLDEEVVAVRPDEGDAPNDLVVAALGQPRAHRGGPPLRIVALGGPGGVWEVADGGARSSAELRARATLGHDLELDAFRARVSINLRTNDRCVLVLHHEWRVG